MESSKLLQLYHERLGHQSKRHVQQVIRNQLGIDVSLDEGVCEGCMYGKMHRLPFGSKNRSRAAAELIHADVCGPFQEPSYQRAKYFVIFKDDYSSYRFIYCIKEKSDVFVALKRFLAEVESVGYSVKRISSDNGGEFKNEQVNSLLREKGIEHTFTMPYTPQQNGSAERDNRTIVEMARCLFYSHERLPQKLWAELVSSAVYILNRTGPTQVKGSSPFELWYKRKPDIRNLRIIGSKCYVHVPKELRRKMDSKAEEGVLVGFEENGYRIWSRIHNKLIRSRDVVFDELPLTRNNVISPIKPTENEEESGSGQVDNKYDTSVDDMPTSRKVVHDETAGQKAENDVETSPMKLRSGRTVVNSVSLADYVALAEVMFCEQLTPQTYSEAVNSEHSHAWLKAMEDEMDSLKENDTWELSVLPDGKSSLPCKWVFKIKTHADGSIERYKARLVAKGYTQRKGEDYEEIFSPVARLGTVRCVLSVAASERMSLSQFDVTTAFLYGDLKEEIYMQQPEGFEDGSGRCCRLKKSLYGLKQSSRCWNEKLSKFLCANGFKQSTADLCLFIKTKNFRKIIVAVYVDDGLVAATEEADIVEFYKLLQKEFKIKTKSLSYFLGLEINQGPDKSITIKQEGYIRRLLERFNMDKCNPLATPLGPENMQVRKVDKEDEPEDLKIPYRQAVGALMYVSCGSRPDLAFALSFVSRFLDAYGHEHWNVIKRIMRYLKGTMDYCIKYRPATNQGKLEVYSDADFAGDQTTRRSTTGVISFYGGGAVTWLSQRQSSVAISTTEAEIAAASEATRESVWLTDLFGSITEITETPTIYVDNEAAVRLAKNPEFHKRTKHIEIRHFFVREKFLEGSIKISRIPSSEQVADLLTKPLLKTRFTDLCTRVGLND